MSDFISVAYCIDSDKRKPTYFKFNASVHINKKRFNYKGNIFTVPYKISPY